jgi:signal transduction histidine kinase
VADTGPGIPASVLGKLFTPFVTTKATGTGLGLSLSARILQEHGGSITGANPSEGGARFVLTLPVSVSEMHHADAVSR